MSVNNENPPEEQRGAASEGAALWIEEEPIPPRRVLHQPEYIRWTNYFQAALLTLFLLLTGGIFIWYHWFRN